MCGWPSSRVTSGAARRAGNAASRIQLSPSPRPPRACTASKSRPGLVTQTTSAPCPSAASRSAAASASGTVAPIAAIVTAGGSAGPAQQVGAGDDLAAAPLPGRRVGRHGGERLVDGPGREPQVRRRAVRAAEPGQRRQQRPLDLDRERRLVGDAAGLLQPDRRRRDRLVRAALGRQRDPGRRADQDRLPARVDPERPRLQRALDERVVEHPDRQQRLPPPAPGGAQLAEQPDEVGLGDAQLQVLAGGPLAPVQDRLGVVGEPVDALAGGPHPDLVDPAAQVGRRADVRGERDHAGRGLGRRRG